MTDPGRYSGKPSKPRRIPPPDVVEVRLTGDPAQIARLISRIAHVVEISNRSRQVPRREEPGRVAVHLHARADGPEVRTDAR